MSNDFVRLHVDGDEIEYAETGVGEPLVLLHAGVFADWFSPVAALPELSGFRVLRVRRAGYLDGVRPVRHLTLEDHARHCASLLDALHFTSAHICGHSSSALIGLQLALDRPDLARTLMLFEPAPGGDLLGPLNTPVIGDVVGPAMAAYAAGDVALGFERFMTAVCGPQHRDVLERVLGIDGYARAVRASAYFPDEAVAVQEWAFNAADAARIGAPALIVQGELTATVAAVKPESVPILASMLSNATVITLADVTHLMPLESPLGVAQSIVEFARRHPISGDSARVPS
jgi:pimeloyl-ACP methyl ester carboxylesterase